MTVFLDLDKIQTMFDSALRLRGVERQQYLNANCGDDPALRGELESLLAAAEHSDGFLSKPIVEIPPPSVETAGQVIGNYQLIEPIGEGGFGIVWRAQQLRPMRREVALKIVKPGMDTAAVLARFAAEQQTLAMLEHPHIARVYDAGATPLGRPFIAMELVSGASPITEYCDAHHLSPRDRIALLADVCDAIQHAHQRGVLHRDLKPTNILLTSSTRDGARPVAKVIDFGIAKLLDAGTNSANPQLTQAVQPLGSPAYMSPEQADPSLGGVDTRTDVWGLGAVMYELLAGAPPRWNRETRDEVAPPKLPATMREAGWIVMRCLQRERDRRYRSAQELAEDLRRFLDGRPIHAAPPDWRYQLAKFARRHALAISATAIVVVALGIGLSMLIVGLRTANQERERAERLAIEAQSQAAEAKRQTAIAQAVNEFNVEVFGLADPSRVRGSGLTVLQAMDDAARLLDEGKLKDQPLAEAAVRDTIGNVHAGLGDFAKAEPHLRRALAVRRANLPPDDPILGESMNNLGLMLRGAGKYPDAMALLTEAVEIGRRTLPTNSDQLAIRIANLGLVYANLGRYPEAEQCYRRAVEMNRAQAPGDPRDLPRHLLHLASALTIQGRPDEAEARAREAIPLMEAYLPKVHPDIADGLISLAAIEQARQNFAQAETYARRALEIRRQVFPEKHPQICLALDWVGRMLVSQNRNGEAEPILREAMAVARDAFPPEHPSIARATRTLGATLSINGKFDEAEPLLRTALAADVAQLGETHVTVAHDRINLGRTLTGLGRFAEAEEQLLRAERTLSTDTAPLASRQKCHAALVALYEQWPDRQSQADRWRRPLSATTQSGRR